MDVPSGTVVLWFGSAASIPAGWTKYAATVGRFVRGVPAGGTVGATGGNAATHVHKMGTALTGGSHTHGDVGFTSGANAAVSRKTFGGGLLTVGPHTHTGKASLGAGGAHTHNPASTNTGAPIGDANPPYVKGIYIVKT
jgi:hypothetical protein